jgi:hypothetical protein
LYVDVALIGEGHAVFAFGRSEPPAVIINRDGDLICLVEGRRGAIERGYPIGNRDYLLG